MSPAQLSRLPVGLATGSMGMHPRHTLDKKLHAIHQAGFKYCEVRFGNYEQWVRARRPDLPLSTAPSDWADDGEPDPSDEVIWQAMFDDAPELLKLAKSLSIEISMIQPMDNFGGWPTGSERGEWAKRKAERWLELCSRLRVDQLQVGSNCHAEADASDEQVAADLRWLAELGAKQFHPVKIAYEPLPFSRRISSWEHGWKLVQLADHENLGLCLDTALMALTPDYGLNPLTGKGYDDNEFATMITRLRQVPVHKIFYVELSELLKPDTPLGQGGNFDIWRETNKPAYGDIFTWCVCARPVAGVSEQGKQGIARVAEVVQVLLEMGYGGPLMFESFEALEMQKDDEEVPLAYARKYAEGWKSLSQ